MATQEREKGNEAFRASDYEEAVRHYNISIETDSNPMAYNNRAMTCKYIIIAFTIHNNQTRLSDKTVTIESCDYCDRCEFPPNFPSHLYLSRYKDMLFKRIILGPLLSLSFTNTDFFRK